jgi:integrase
MYTRRQLTQQLVDRIKAPKEGRDEHADTLAPGLVLRVSKTGHKSWCVFWKVRGADGLKDEQRRKNLVGFLPLTDARDQARSILADASGGHADAHVQTVAEIGARYVESERPHLAAKTIGDIASVLKRHVYPVLGSRLMSQVETADVERLLDTKTIGVARNVRKYVSGLYSWAVARGHAKSNPVRALSKKTRRRLAYPTDAGRALADEELRALWAAAERMGYPYGPYYQLVMLTGQRPYEWRDARWSEIAHDTLVVPPTRYKTRGRSHAVPLVPAAREILRRVPRGICCNVVFHKRGACGPLNGQAKRDQDLARLAGVDDFAIYDLRKTCATRLAELGFDPVVIDQVQGRSLTPLQRTYIRHDYEREKRAALEQYARHVLKVVGTAARSRRPRAAAA